MIFMFFSIIGFIILYCVIEYGHFIPAFNGLTVLMYHKVSDNKKDKLTVTIDQLNQQLEYLEKTGFNPISFNDFKTFEKGLKTLPKKPVILSFDDGYRNNLDLAYPLLRRYKFPAIFFICTDYIGKTNGWDNGNDPIMDHDTLKELAESGLVEIGLHSHKHINYEKSSLDDVELDLKACINTLIEHNIHYSPVLAYPYGKLPLKDKLRNAELKKMLMQSGIDYALCIDSKINRLPISDPYEMTRTSVRGSESFFVFKIKLNLFRFGLCKVL